MVYFYKFLPNNVFVFYKMYIILHATAPISLYKIRYICTFKRHPNFMCTRFCMCISVVANRIKNSSWESIHNVENFPVYCLAVCIYIYIFHASDVSIFLVAWTHSYAQKSTHWMNILFHEFIFFCCCFVYTVTSSPDSSGTRELHVIHALMHSIRVLYLKFI